MHISVIETLQISTTSRSLDTSTQSVHVWQDECPQHRKVIKAIYIYKKAIYNLLNGIETS